MTGFVLARTPAVAVGPARIETIGADVARLAGEAASVLLVADPGLQPLGITARVEGALTGAGHRVTLFDGFTPDPQEAHVAAGAAMAWEAKAQAVIGLGGGSALDASKMVSVAMLADRPLAAYRLAATPLPARRVSLVSVPTTAGTGSETTAVSILSGDDKTKYWFWGDALKPDFIVLDPELTIGLPPALTVATGLDALVHAIEAMTSRNASPGNDFYARPAIEQVIEYLPKAVSQPADTDARTRMLLAATTAGVAIDNAGTALAHNIGHSLGSLMPIHHGHAVALAMEASLPWVIEGNPKAFARVAEAFGLGRNIDALPRAYSNLLDEVGFDRRLPASVDVVALAGRMAAPENAAMLDSTARAAGEADLHLLAGTVLRLGGQSSEAA